MLFEQIFNFQVHSTQQCKFIENYLKERCLSLLNFGRVLFYLAPDESHARLR